MRLFKIIFSRCINKIVIFFFLICTGLKGNGQELTIGQTIPDVKLLNVLNYPKGEINISEFNGKLIILDFWNFNCLNCLQSFAHVDSIQKSFGNKIQIILVNKEKKEATEEFFRKRPRLVKPDLLMVMGDTILNAMFPHIGDPYYIWIDKGKKILYKTSGAYATTKNIDDVLKGKNPKLPAREPQAITAETFLEERFVGLPRYYSMISGYYDYFVLQPIQEIDGYIVLTFNALTPIALYQSAFDGLTNYQFQFTKPGRTILEEGDFRRFLPPSAKELVREWRIENLFTYRLQWPENRKNEAFKIMKEDLDRYFGFAAGLEERSISCLSLVRIGDEDKLQTKGGKKYSNFSQTNERTIGYDSVRRRINMPFSGLSRLLQVLLEKKYEMPVIDETNYEGNIDFEMKAIVLDSLDIDELRKSLNKYGLDLVEKKKVMTVLVIKDKN